MSRLGSILELCGAALIVWDLWLALKAERTTRDVAQGIVDAIHSAVARSVSATVQPATVHAAAAVLTAHVTSKASAEVKHGGDEFRLSEHASVEKLEDALGQVGAVHTELEHLRGEFVRFRDDLEARTTNLASQLDAKRRPGWRTIFGSVITVVGLLIELTA